MSEAVNATGRFGYTYADLHVGMAFRSPGRTITDADLVAFAGLTDKRIVQHGRKALLVWKGPLTAVEASQ